MFLIVLSQINEIIMNFNRTHENDVQFNFKTGAIVVGIIFKDFMLVSIYKYLSHCRPAILINKK